MLNEGRVRQLTFDSAISRNGMAAQGQHRERGLWKFLTWSFFLSQLAAGNAFATGAAQAVGSTELHADDGAVGGATTGAHGVGGTDHRAIGIGEPQDTAPGNAAQAQSTATVSGAKADGIDGSSAAADGASGVQVMLVSGGSSDGATAIDAPPQGVPTDAVPLIDPAININLDLPLVGGVLETVNDLVGGLGPTLDGLLLPVVETVEDLGNVLGPTLDLALSPVANIVDGLTETLEPAFDPLLTPVATISEGIGGLIGPVGQLAGEIMTLADPVFDIAHPLLSPVMSFAEAAEPILQPVLDIATPVADLVGPVTAPLLEPLASVADPVLDLLPPSLGQGGLLGGLFSGDDGQSGGIAASGTLAFGAEASIAGYELFGASGYTEFGVALHETAEDCEPAGADIVANVGASIDTLLTHGDHDGNTLQSLLGSLQHEVALRGLGEGLI